MAKRNLVTVMSIVFFGLVFASLRHQGTRFLGFEEMPSPR
jgi:hypothetical protein